MSRQPPLHPTSTRMTCVMPSSGTPMPLRPGPSTPVQHTISQDCGEGHAAHAESGLARLAGVGGPHPFGPSGGPVSNLESEQSLADYQTQLMVLEQQNRRRLLMARAEQDQQGLFDAGSEGAMPTPDVNSNAWDQGGDSGEPRVGHAGIAESERDGMPDTVYGSPDSQEPGPVVLYRVFCSTVNPKCDQRIYETEPCLALVDGQFHLTGAEPLRAVAAFVASQGPCYYKSFVVYRVVHCVHRVETLLPWPQNGPSALVLVLSKELQAALRNISLFAPDTATYARVGRPQPAAARNFLLSLLATEYSMYFLYHHQAALRELATSEACVEDAKHLWSYLQDHPDPMTTKCDELFTKGQVSSETLPWLLRPYEVVVSNEGQHPVAYVVNGAPAAQMSDSVQLECWNWAYDGTTLHRRLKSITAAVPWDGADGTASIRDLSVYPMRFADEQTKERLFARGQAFWGLRHQTYVSYEGPDYQGERVYPWDSRCMIDYKTYHSFHRNADAFRFASGGQSAPFDPWPYNVTVSQTTVLSQLETMLLPPGIHGFLLKDKKWVHLLVDNISPVNWNKDAFNKVVLPARIKNLVKALVLVRKTGATNPSASQGTKGRRSDLISGKGAGLIMLLHGGPGTGKTLTAESVAELAEMPLYNVTCGDIGTRPEAVESYLSSVLYLGQKWNCVLLLDEADVFLEQRSLSDLTRNSLVSVFLRTLEYYPGILILTSNRVTTFDSAFKSRIQVALHYPALDAAGRRAVWHNFFDMLRADANDDDSSPNLSLLLGNGDDAEEDEKRYAARVDELAKLEMNGREIRNAVTTARQLALFEGVPLGWGHVEQAVGVAREFERWRDGVAGEGEERAGISEEEWVLDGGSILGSVVRERLP